MKYNNSKPKLHSPFRTYRKNFKLLTNFSKILLVSLLLFLIIKWMISNQNSKPQLIDSEFEFNYKQTKDYTDNCVRLYKKIRDNKLVFEPPLQELPKGLENKFVKDGDMIVSNYVYLDNTIKDSNDSIQLITNKDLSILSDFIDDASSLDHGPKIIKEQLEEYWHKVKKAHVLVLGSEKPWVEVIASNLGAEKVYTLEYTKKSMRAQNLNGGI